MKPYFTIIIIASLILYCSCSSTSDEQPEDDRFTSEMPDFPEWIEFDLDDDGNLDYVLEYRLWDIDPVDASTSGYQLISGQITSYGMNQVLRNNDEPILFLSDLGLIRESVNDPLYWNKPRETERYTWIVDTPDGKWPKTWEVASNTNESSYFFGLKLVSNNATKLGWIEIAINANDGSVDLLEKGIL